MECLLALGLVIGLVMAAMAVGVIMGRAPIKGSCGGLGAVGIDQAQQPGVEQHLPASLARPPRRQRRQQQRQQGP